MVWVVSGARRHVGKTWLCLRLQQLLPAAAYVKLGHAPRQPNKPGTYLTSLRDVRLLLRNGIAQAATLSSSRTCWHASRRVTYGSTSRRHPGRRTCATMPRCCATRRTSWLGPAWIPGSGFASWSRFWSNGRRRCRSARRWRSSAITSPGHAQPHSGSPAH